MELIGWMGSIDRFDRWNRSIGSIGILDVIDRIDRIIRSMDARSIPSLDRWMYRSIASFDRWMYRSIASFDRWMYDRSHHSIDGCTDRSPSFDRWMYRSIRFIGTDQRDAHSRHRPHRPIDPSTDRPIDRPRRPTPSTMDDSLQSRRCIAIITITTIRTRRRVSTPARTFPVDRIDRTHFLTPSPRHHARRRASDRAVRRAALTARDSSESSRIATHSFEIRRRRAGETGDERGFVQG